MITTKTRVMWNSFNPLDNNLVSKCINKLGMKKAPGIDDILARIVKLSDGKILNPVTNIANFCLSQNVSHDRIKIAQVAPLHKKKYLVKGKL